MVSQRGEAVLVSQYFLTTLLVVSGCVSRQTLGKRAWNVWEAEVKAG